jgi:hypothetical protein
MVMIVWYLDLQLSVPITTKVVSLTRETTIFLKTWRLSQLYIKTVTIQ